MEQVKEQFKKVIEYSQRIPDPQVDELFERWYEAKRDYIEAFGGKLIWECPTKVTFELSQAVKQERLNQFITMINDGFQNEPLGYFLEDNREGFFKNTIVHGGTVRLYNGEVIDIPEGMKLIKAFKYFEDDPITLKDLQTQASMIIQEDKVTGTLCLSVHPLDFLSSSENTYNWRSCHALDGEYRAGNFSYMTDKSTIMCYLKGADMAKLPNFPDTVRWNSKKWRMLLFLSEHWDAMFAGRQYPFFSRAALDIVMGLLKQRIASGFWSEWHNDMLTSFNYKEGIADGGGLMWSYICLNNELYPLQDVVKDGKYSQAFPFFGVERRGAPVMAFTRIDSEPINLRYQVYNPDHVIVLDDGLLSVVDVYSGLKEDGEVIINTHEKVESASHKVFDVDATGIALEILGVNIVNTIILGYFAKKTGEVSIESLIEVIKETFPGPIGEKNAVAAQKAYDMA
mgnify:CR=1 FL=1